MLNKLLAHGFHSEKCRLHGYLVVAQLSFAGFEILSRIALTNGTDPIAFTFYRNCVASILLGVVAFITEKKQQRPDFRALLYFFGLGFLGVTVNQVCYLTGLKYTSAIFASAMRNSTPVFTFAIAALWRIERVNLKRRDGQAKLVGSLLGLFGSLILSIYRGPVVIESNISIPETSGNTKHVDANAKKTLYLLGKIHITLASWQIGAVFLTLSCIAFAGFLILQTPVLHKYSAPISFAAFTCFSSVLQVPIIGAVYSRDADNWKLSTSKAYTILYAGVMASGLVSTIQSWGVFTGGPVIVAAYQPLETIFTAIFSMIFLEEDLHLGSVVGGVIVITGLYLLVWGQEKERRLEEEASTLPVDGQLSSTLSALNALELHPNPLLKYHLRRQSCDLETRKKEGEHNLVSVRRHSIAFCHDSQDTTEKQNDTPLRRLSSTLSNLVRDLERRADPNAVENHQLLTTYQYRSSKLQRPQKIQSISWDSLEYCILYRLNRYKQNLARGLYLQAFH